MIRYNLKQNLKELDKESELNLLIEKYILPKKSIIEKTIFDLLAQKYQNKVTYEKDSDISFNGFTIKEITAHYHSYNLNEIEEAQWRIFIRFTYNEELDTVDIPLFKIYTTGIEKILLNHQKSIEKSLTHSCLEKEF